MSGSKPSIGLYVNNWIFGAECIEDTIERVSSLGFDGLEVVGEPDELDASRVRSLVSNAGMRVISICGMFPGPGTDDLRALCHIDSSKRSKAVNYIRQCIDFAAELEARSVLVVPGLVGRPAFFTSREEDWKRAVESIAQVADYARAEDILLTIEPINRYEVGLVNSLGEAIRMAEEIGHPNVRAMGDTFHMQIEESDGIPNAIRRGGQHWVQHLHAADNTREAPGLGTFNWREIVRSLLDINYEGGVSMEPLPRGAQPYDAREGRIPADVLDRGLRFGLEHLRWCLEVNTYRDETHE